MTHSREQLAAVKRAAAERLCEAGEASNEFNTVSILVARARRIFGPKRRGETDTEFLQRIARTPLSGSGKVAGRRYTPPFREYRPTPHLRQAEIDAAPRQISMGGIGNGMQTWHGWGQ